MKSEIAKEVNKQNKVEKVFKDSKHNLKNIVTDGTNKFV